MKKKWLILGISALTIVSILLGWEYYKKTSNLVDSEDLTIKTRHFDKINLSGSAWSLYESSSSAITKGSLNITPDTALKPLRTAAWWKHTALKGCDSYVYPYPYTAYISKNGLALGVAKKVINDRYVIASKDTPLIITTETEYDGCLVDNPETLTSDFVFTKNNTTGLTATMSKGLPFVYINTPTNSVTLKLINSKVTLANETSTLFLIKNPEITFGVKFKHPTQASITSNETVFKNSDKETSFVIFYLPDEKHILSFSDMLKTEKPKLSTGFYVKDNKVVQVFKQSYPSPFLLLPHQKEFLHPSTQIIDWYKADSLRGTMYLVNAKDISLEYPLNAPDIFPKISLSTEEKSKLKDLFEADYKKIDANILNNDAGVYWKGKILYKLSNLLYIADLLEDKEKFDVLSNLIETELFNWSNYSGDQDKNYFIFDPILGGVQASRPEYGHEKYNDHHFQLGYFIYAYSTLLHYDRTVSDKYGNFVEYIIRNVHSFDTNDPSFPYLRHFDMYEGHSYATGLDYFIDGNNQESTSEAINSWYASYMWYKLRGDTEMSDLYLSGYVAEALATNTYYFDLNDNSSVFPDGYKHPLTSVLWEGKYEFATWFSPDPNHVHGIQTLPITFGSGYLVNPDYAKRNMDSLKIENKNNFEEWADINSLYMHINKLPQASEIEKKIKVYDSGTTSSWYYLMKTYFGKN